MTASSSPRWGSGEIRTGEVELFGADRRRTNVFNPGEPFVARIHYEAHQSCKEPVFGVGVYRSDGTYVNGSNHFWRRTPVKLGRVEPGETGYVEMAFESLPLLHGQYYLTAFLYDHGKPAPTPIDHREHAVTFEVLDADRMQHGLLFLPTRWSVHRKNGGGTLEAFVSEE